MKFGMKFVVRIVVWIVVIDGIETGGGLAYGVNYYISQSLQRLNIINLSLKILYFL